MTGSELLKILTSRGCVIARQKGSHVIVRCGTCTTVVPVHGSQTLGKGLLREIERQLEPCLGERWMTK